MAAALSRKRPDSHMLKTRWLKLADRLGYRRDASAEWARIADAYGEHARVYHNLDHLRDCLGQFDDVRSACTAPDAVELAIWYHDLIYDTRRSDNEQRSAAEAESFCVHCDAAKIDASRVVELIIATTHGDNPLGGDDALLADIDLSILGQPAERYDVYAAAIRLDYGWVSEDAYRNGRSQVLERFLARARIYATDHFATKFEQSARQNIGRELARLAE